MLLSWNSFFLLATSLFIATSCSQSRVETDEQASILTNGGKGRYWDRVCSSNGLNRYNVDIMSGGRYPYNETRGIPQYTFFFGAKNRLMFYLNVDSTRIVDMDVVAGDIEYNPANYKLMGNKISLIGDTSEIMLLNADIMVLRRIGKGNYIQVYVPSRWQSKVECKNLDCQ